MAAVSDDGGFLGGTPLYLKSVISGNYAYSLLQTDRRVADQFYSYGLAVYDINDPRSPQFVTGVLLSTAYHSGGGLAVAGNYVYVVHGFSVTVIDISDPSTPQLVGGLETLDSAVGLEVSGDYAYVVGRVLGLQVVDIGDPINPRLAGGVDTPGHANGVKIAGDYAYVADGKAGVHIAWLQCDDSDQEVIIDIKPGNDTNPINCKGQPGIIPVAVLTTNTFDALTTDHTTVRFGLGEAAELHVRTFPTSHGDCALALKPVSGES